MSKMKKKMLFTSSCLFVGCVVLLCGGLAKSAPTESSLTLENVEALAEGDVVTIVCGAGHDGKCFRKGFSLKFCNSHSYYQCEYTGYTMDYCKNPC